MNRTLCPELAGFLSAAVFSTLMLSLSGPFGSVYGDYGLEDFAVSIMVFFPISLVAVIVLGIPAFALLYPLRPG